MSKGLQQLLARIIQEPTRLMIDRYMALLADLTEQEGKTSRALDLAEALMPTDAKQALRIALMVHQTQPKDLRAYDVMIAGLSNRGRYAKAEVLRQQRERLVASFAPEHGEASQESAGSQINMEDMALDDPDDLSLVDPSDLQVGSAEFSRPGVDSAEQAMSRDLDFGTSNSIPFRPTLTHAPVQPSSVVLPTPVVASPKFKLAIPELDFGPVGALAPPLKLDLEPAGLAFGADGLNHSAFDRPPDQAEVFVAGEPLHDLTRDPTLNLTRDPTPESKLSSIREPTLVPSAERLSSRTNTHFTDAHASPATWARFALNEDTSLGKGSQPTSTQHSPAGTKSVQTPAEAASKPAVAEVAKAKTTPVQGMAVFWAKIVEEFGHLEADTEQPLGWAQALGSAKSRVEKRLEPLPDSFWQALAVIPQAQLADTNRAQNLQVLADILLRLLDAETATAYGLLIERLQATRESPEFWVLYLDTLLLRGQSRRALVEVRLVLNLRPEPEWAAAAWSRLNEIWAAMAVRGFEWHEEAGVMALLKGLEQRPKLKTAGLVI